MAYGRHHGKGQHTERDVAVPSMPRSALVVIETELILVRFEAVLNRPAVSFNFDEFGDASPGRTPRREVGKSAVCHVAADQKTARPQARRSFVVLRSIEVGEFAISPVIEPRPFGAVPGREPPPVRGISAKLPQRAPWETVRAAVSAVSAACCFSCAARSRYFFSYGATRVRASSAEMFCDFDKARATRSRASAAWASSPVTTARAREALLQGSLG